MCGFEGTIYVQTRFISTLLRPTSFTKNNLVFFRRPFCSSFIQIAFLGKLHCKDMYKLYLRSIVCKSGFCVNFANYKTHASIFIGISKQMKSLPFSS